MLNVNVINAKNTQKLEVKPGQPVNLKVDPNTRFELVDPANGKAPTQIKARRVGDNLEIVTDEKAQIEDEAVSNAQTPDLVLENYYKQEDVSLFAGEGEQAVSYVPVDGAAYSSYAAMNTSATTGAAVAALPLLSPWVGVAAGAGLAAAGGGGGGSGSSPQVANKAPVAKDDVKSVTENGTLEGSVPSATDPDGAVVRYELVSNVANSDGILIFNSNGTYKFKPSNFDYLAEGEKATVTFKYTAVDGYGAKSEPKTVTITVTGTNDNPEIVAINSGNQPDISNVMLTENGKGISTHGTLTVQDKDIYEPVSFILNATKVDFEGTTFMHINPDESPEIVDFVLPLLTLKNTIGKLVTDPHNLTWNFDYLDSDASFFSAIPEGQTLVINYTIEVMDPHGSVATKVITVSILGTNDAPVVNVDAGHNSVLELAETNGIIQGGDELTLMDPDINDYVTFHISKVLANGYSIDPANDELQFWDMLKVSVGKDINGNPLTLSDSNNIRWDFSSVHSYDFDPLQKDSVLKLEYTIEFTDSHGAVSEKTISVNITGTNDAPLIFTDIETDSADEKIDGNFDAQGTFTVIDEDVPLSSKVSVVKLKNDLSPAGQEIDISNINLASLLTTSGTFVDKNELHNLTWKFNGEATLVKDLGLSTGAYTLVYDIAISDQALTSHQTVNIHFQV
ncbi:MAG: hypothetical protein CFE39_02090 [Comamonadaceae bacterium PBBC2]|nr:MAG: hypothetical protein CFE39_02090 [Comamonadaceae bacterium PBBC2]